MQKNKMEVKNADSTMGEAVMNESPVVEQISNGGGDMTAEGNSEDNPAMADDSVKEFVVDGSNFKFSVAEIKVNKGDKVRIVFNNVEGFHDWVVDEFNVRTQKLQAGKSETIEFVADKFGTFEYYCSVGSHRQMGMVGNLIVE